MLRILKNIKNNFIILISLFLISPVLAVGKPSSKYDGAYTFSDYCRGSKNSNAYDGSQFIIKDGMVTNDRGGAGRWTLDEKKSRVDDKGKIYIKGERRGNKSIITGNLNDDEKKHSVYQFKRKVGGKSQYYGDKKYGNLKMKRKYKGDSDYVPCVINLKRIGDVPKKVVSKDDRKVTEITITSKNTNDDLTLLNDQGKDEKIRVELRNLDSISNGLIIVVPSSTPNMDDEIYYEKQVSKYGYATAIVYGAEPRYQKKFTGSYTSSMILYDAIATIEKVTKLYGKTKEVILIGSSTGSLAIFKAGWQDLRDKYPSMNLITKGFMINAACPDISEVNFSDKIKMFAINGQQDESTPPWVCKNLKDSSKNPNLYLLTYSGGHHFESRMYPPSRYDTESAHALPTCSLNYKSNLHQVIKRRDGSKEWNGENQGYKKDQKKWFGENCIDKGTLQGYEEYGAKQFWTDVKSIIVDKKDAKSLKGYTE